MSSKLIKNGSGIINPFSKPVMVVTIDDRLQATIETKLPPNEVAKILMSTAVDLMFSYTEQYAKFQNREKTEDRHDHNQHEEGQPTA